MTAWAWLASASLVAAGAAARADEGARDGGDQAGPTGGARTATAASAGDFLAFSQPASVTGQRAFASGLAGYDGARRTADVEAMTEVRLWGPLTVRGGAVYTNANRTLRPSFGARVQVLEQGRAGVDAALGVFYRPEGLTEPEGEIESVVSVGRRVGRAYLLGNLLYGQDPEGRERDGEVRLAALRPLGARLLVGVDGRGRFDLGSDPSLLASHMEATWDGAVGPTATALVGPLALSVEMGASGQRLLQHTSLGLFVMTGVGAAF